MLQQRRQEPFRFRTIFFGTLAEERGALRTVFSTLQEHKWEKFIYVTILFRTPGEPFS